MLTTKKTFDIGNAVAYMQDSEFIQFVEEAGAKEIKGSAKDAGFLVEDYGCWFNVVYSPIKNVEDYRLHREVGE